MSQTAVTMEAPREKSWGTGLSAGRKAYDRVLRALVWLCAGLTCALLLSLIFMGAMVLLDICYALIDPKIGARYKK